MNREKLDKFLNEISKSVVDKIISQFRGFVFHHGGFLKMDGDDPSPAFLRKGEIAFLADTEIVPHRCVNYPEHTCTRCQPGSPLCLKPEDAAIYHGDIDGDGE